MSYSNNKTYRWLVAILWSSLVVGTTGFLYLQAGGANPLDLVSHPEVDPQKVIVVSRDGLTLRASVKPGSEKLGTIPYGTVLTLAEQDSSPPAVVKIDGMTGNWQKVIWDKNTGYVFSGYLVAAFFEPAKAPETLAEAIAPWVKNGKVSVSWLKPSDLWVLESEVWGFRQINGTAIKPSVATELTHSAKYFTGQEVKDDSVLYGIDDGKAVFSVSREGNGYSWVVTRH